MSVNEKLDNLIERTSKIEVKIENIETILDSIVEYHLKNTTKRTGPRGLGWLLRLFV